LVAVTTAEMPRPGAGPAKDARAAGAELLAYLLFWHSVSLGAEAMTKSRDKAEGDYTAQTAKAQQAEEKASSWNGRLGPIGWAAGKLYGYKADKASTRARESRSNADSATSVIEWAGTYHELLAAQLSSITFLRGGRPFNF
jgi:hypothetical protein